MGEREDREMTAERLLSRTAVDEIATPPDRLRVRGGARLRGTVHTSGFKHSLVTTLSAALAADAEVTLVNCPDIAETRTLIRIIDSLGGTAHLLRGRLRLNASTLRTADFPAELAGAIHGIVYLVPALLARFGTVRVPIHGGCQIGDGPRGRRPIEQYVSVLERFGALATVEPPGVLEVRARRLHGCEIDLLDYTSDRSLRTGPLYSGACKMALLAASVAHGTSTLHNLYPKPDVVDLVDVLAGLGAEVDRPSPGSVRIHGRGPRALDRDHLHTLVPDLIEVVTWICAGAMFGAEPMRIDGPEMARAVTALAPELEFLRRLGVEVDEAADHLVVRPTEHLRAAELTVASHGVFSDSQPLLALLTTMAAGASTITDTVWGSRFSYAEALRALGADMEQHGATLVVRGPCRPARPGQAVRAGDLRAASTLLLAAIGVPGVTTIAGTSHLVRGYHDLPGALRAAGADIEPIEAK